MKVAIVGAGVAGSFLSSMLKKSGHEVKVFESSSKEGHFPICAWGTCKNILYHYSKLADLDFNDYILHIGKEVRMLLPNGELESLKCIGLVTYDKARWEHDLLKGVDINYNSRVTIKDFPLYKYDYVLDCTGFHRSMLPRVEDFIVPAYEYLVEFTNVEVNYEYLRFDDFYIIGYRNATGYFWYFPLGDKDRVGSFYAWIGAGDINKRYYGINEFFDKCKGVKVIKKIGRPIRITPPTRMEPFFYKNVIGVGESIGCVFPLLGEGIIPSLICSELLLNSIEHDRIDIAYYRENVLKRFKYYDDVYRLVRLMIDRKFSKLRHLNLLYRIYKNMKKEEARFGFEVSLDKLRKMLNALQ